MNLLTIQLFKFFLRVVIATIAVCSIFIVLQDLQIFPGASISIFNRQRAHETIPKDVIANWMTTEDGEKLEVWRVNGKESSSIPGKKIIALLFHGNADSVDSFYGVQKWLEQLGITSYSYDYRGYGYSSGWPSEDGLYRDADALLKLVSSEIDLANSKIMILGSSIGSGIAAYAASKHPPDILLLLSPYTSLKGVVDEIPFFGSLSSFLFYELPTSRYIQNLDKTCVIAVHGSDDTTIPPSNTERLWQDFKYKENFIKLIIPQTGHNDLLSNSHLQISSSIHKCLES